MYNFIFTIIRGSRITSSRRFDKQFSPGFLFTEADHKTSWPFEHGYETSQHLSNVRKAISGEEGNLLLPKSERLGTTVRKRKCHRHMAHGIALKPQPRLTRCVQKLVRKTEYQRDRAMYEKKASTCYAPPYHSSLDLIFVFYSPRSITLRKLSRHGTPSRNVDLEIYANLCQYAPVFTLLKRQKRESD